MSVDEENKIAKAAQEYRAVGVSVCRNKPGLKEPAAAGWAERSHDPADFSPDENLGLSCGWLSNGGVEGQFLMCVDLDVTEAIEQADRFLPATGAIEGRNSKPRSHWWFYVTGVPEWAISTAAKAAAAAAAAGKCPGPKKFSFKKIAADPGTGKRGTVIDFIGTGAQTVVPPSYHRKSGEHLRWEDNCSFAKIATVPFTELWEAVCRLAETCGAKVPDVGQSVSADESEDVAEPTETITAATACVDAAAEPAGQVQGTCTRECDVPMDERVRRCEAYLRSVDLARSGHGGHGTTYRTARLVCNDFAVVDRERALALLRAYNRRLKQAGEEEWSDRELEHKLDSALAAPDDPNYPFGCKLKERPTCQPPRAWDDPSRLADAFLREHTVRFVKQTAFAYCDGAYQTVTSEWLSAQVRGCVEREAVREWDRRQKAKEARRAELEKALAATPVAPSTPGFAAYAAEQKAVRGELAKLDKVSAAVPPVYQPLVNNTMAAVAAHMQLPDNTELDTWLGDMPGPAVVAVANGLLDPVGRTLTPHTAAWFSTVRLPVVFDATAPSPTKWLAFLGDVMEGDAERVVVLQELFGACLDRTAPGKWFAALVGSGDNGKSVALAVLSQLLGRQNCSAVQLDQLSASQFATFGLFGKLANVAGDQGHFESVDEGRLKTLTGGDLVTFEQKGKDPFVAPNRAKLIFACNAMPTFADKSEAVWNRLVALPFEYAVPACKKNPAMLTAEYWADELPGILNWALEGLARFREQGGRFTRSAKCEAMKGQTRLDSNPARLFLTEECEYTGAEEDRIPIDDLYQAYAKWCENGGFTRRLTKVKFGKEVLAAFPQLPPAKNARYQEHPRRCWIGLKRPEVTEVTDASPVA